MKPIEFFVFSFRCRPRLPRPENLVKINTSNPSRPLRTYTPEGPPRSETETNSYRSRSPIRSRSPKRANNDSRQNQWTPRSPTGIDQGFSTQYVLIFYSPFCFELTFCISKKKTSISRRARSITLPRQ